MNLKGSLQLKKKYLELINYYYSILRDSEEEYRITYQTRKKWDSDDIDSFLSERHDPNRDIDKEKSDTSVSVSISDQEVLSNSSVGWDFFDEKS